MDDDDPRYEYRSILFRGKARPVPTAAKNVVGSWHPEPKVSSSNILLMSGSSQRPILIIDVHSYTMIGHR